MTWWHQLLNGGLAGEWPSRGHCYPDYKRNHEACPHSTGPVHDSLLPAVEEAQKPGRSLEPKAGPGWLVPELVIALDLQALSSWL